MSEGRGRETGDLQAIGRFEGLSSYRYMKGGGLKDGGWGGKLYTIALHCTPGVAKERRMEDVSSYVNFPFDREMKWKQS